MMLSRAANGNYSTPTRVGGRFLPQRARFFREILDKATAMLTMVDIVLVFMDMRTSTKENTRWLVEKKMPGSAETD
jgi:hypothetical protein